MEIDRGVVVYWYNNTQYVAVKRDPIITTIESSNVKRKKIEQEEEVEQEIKRSF